MPFVDVIFHSGQITTVRVDNAEYRRAEDTHKVENGFVKVEEFNRDHETHTWRSWPAASVRELKFRYY